MNIDNLSEIKKLDSKNMLGSIEQLSEQVKQVAQMAGIFKLPAIYKKCNKILVLGMGGSALGAHFVKSVYAMNFKLPIEIVNDYHVPAWVDKNTLIVFSSYSGTTEEVLSAAVEAKKSGAKIVGLTIGGKLLEFLKKNKLPCFVFDPKYNDCGSPRMGLGYAIAGLLVLFSKIGLIKSIEKDLSSLARTISNSNDMFKAKQAESANGAKMLARQILGKSVFVVGADHLAGNAHIFANQINENAKCFAGYFLLPELDHHLLEGTINPQSIQQGAVFLFLESDLYDKRVCRRIAVTKKILDKNGIDHVYYSCTGADHLSEAAELLALSSYTSFYLAMLSGIDPTPIPFVNYLKEELKVVK